jgi:hypothetical protein
MLATAAVTKNHRQTHPTPPVIPNQSLLNSILFLIIAQQNWLFIWNSDDDFDRST